MKQSVLYIAAALGAATGLSIIFLPVVYTAVLLALVLFLVGVALGSAGGAR